MKKIIRVVTTQEKNITAREARSLVVEARINVSGRLDCYEAVGNGNIARVFSLEVPVHWNNDGDLLEYARDNIPEDVIFGR